MPTARAFGLYDFIAFRHIASITIAGESTVDSPLTTVYYN